MSTTAPIPVKPKRSLRRWYVVGGFLLAVAATPFVYAWITDWIRQRELDALIRELDEKDPHWRWHDLVSQMPAAPPDDKNAAVLLLAVGQSMKGPFVAPKSARERKRTNRNARLTPNDAALLRAALANQPIAVARRLKDLPEGRVPKDRLRNPLENDQSTIMFWPMDLLRHDAVLRADDGDVAGAAESCLAILHGANALHDAPSLMVHLVRTAGHQHALAALERTLAHGELAPEQLQALQWALEREARNDSVYQALRSERAFGYVYYLLVLEGKLPEPVLNGDGTARNFEVLRRLFSRSFVHDYPAELRKQTELVQASRLPDRERIEAFRTFAANYEPHPNLASILLSSNGREMIQSQACVRCAVIAVAAERYRLEFQRWPRDAAQLVEAKLLSEAPIDPFDGQPLRWRHTPRGLIIYSIGEDGADDSAKLPAHELRVAAEDVGFILWSPGLRHAPPIVSQGKD